MVLAHALRRTAGRAPSPSRVVTGQQASTVAHASRWPVRRHRLGSLLTAALFGAAGVAACLQPPPGDVQVLAPRQDPALPTLSPLVRRLEPPASLPPGDGSPGSAGTGVVDIGTDVSPGLPPARALEAYRRAATVLARADPTCGLSWPLLAAIGAVESDHGQVGGSALDDAGVAHPAILGPPLDGTSSTSRIDDTDHGDLDGDPGIDRAVGPMQLIPSTWEAVAVDGDADGVRDPQDIDDASLAAGVYLCAWHDDLATDAGLRAAVFRYNRSTAYVERVVQLMSGYAEAGATAITAVLVSATASPAVEDVADGQASTAPGLVPAQSPDPFWSSPPLVSWVPAPTPAPSPAPPTPAPTPQPSTVPTSPPTAEPTSEPTPEPTSEPTPEPTTEPTSQPTIGPATGPTSSPTSSPTSEPTRAPPRSLAPSVQPTTPATSSPHPEGVEPTRVTQPRTVPLRTSAVPERPPAGAAAFPDSLSAEERAAWLVCTAEQVGPGSAAACFEEQLDLPVGDPRLAVLLAQVACREEDGSGATESRS